MHISSLLNEMYSRFTNTTFELCSFLISAIIKNMIPPFTPNGNLH